MRGFALANSALVNLDDSGITGSTTVTAWANSGTGGSDYSLAGVGTAANLRRAKSGLLSIYGASGNGLVGPVLDLSNPTTIAIPVYVDVDDYTPSSAITLCGQWEDTGDERAVLLELDTDGTLKVSTSSDGTAAAVVSSSSTVAITEAGWVLVILHIANNTMNPYTASGASNADPTDLTWALLGDADVAHTSGGIKNSAANFTVGCNQDDATAGNVTGNLGRAMVFTGANAVATGVLTTGTEQADADPSQYASGATLTSGGDAYTLTGNVYIQNSGYDAVATAGAAGLRAAVAQAITNGFTVFMVVHGKDYSAASDQIWVDGHTDAGDRCALYTNNSPSFRVFRITDNTGITTAPTDRTTYLVDLVGDTTSILTASGLGSVSAAVGTATWDYGTIFYGLDGSLDVEGGFMLQLIVFPRVLTAAERADVRVFLTSKFGI